MDLSGKKIGFAVTGSFCTLGIALAEAKKLVEAGAEVYPIFSENVQSMDTKFGLAKDWQEQFTQVCQREIIRTIVEAEPIGPKGYLDCLVIAPCTGNTMGKLVGGITDGPVLMATKAHLRNNKPVVVAVATNDGLSKNGKNIGALLNEHNIYMVPFGQDDPLKKPFSVIANMTLLAETIVCALAGKQLQPILDK